jgi:hypothetical protein
MDMNKKFQNLKKWITDNGGFIHDSLNLDILNSSRGIVVKEKIPQGTKLYEIPLLLTININLSSEINKFESKGVTYNQHLIKKILLIQKLYLEFQKKEESFYYHYLSLLPLLKDLSDQPLYKAYYNKDIKTFVEKFKVYNERVILLILEELENVNQCITYFNSLEQTNNKIISCEDILYYYLLINTRSWGEYGMVPFLDLFQHRSINYTEFIDDTVKKILKCTSNKKLRENRFVYINYGIFDEEKLYTNYGFIAQNKKVSYPRFTNVFLNLQIDQKNNLDQFIYNQISILNSNTNIKNKLYFSNEEKLNETLMYYLRIINLNLTDMKNIDWTQTNLYYSNRISLENELKCYKMLLSLINSKFEIQKKLDIINKNDDEFLQTLKLLSNIEINNLTSLKLTIVKLWNGLLDIQ